MKKLLILRIFATVLIFGFLLTRFAGLSDVISSILNFDWKMIVLILFMTIITLLLRVLRWVVITKDYRKLDFRSALYFYTVGIFYASITPGRLGEVLRGIMYSSKTNAGRITGILTVLIDRAWDILMLALIALLYLVSRNMVFILLMAFLTAPILYYLGFLIFETIKFRLKRFRKLAAKLSLFKPEKQSLLSVYHIAALILIQYLVYSYIFMLILNGLGVFGISMSYIMMGIAVSMLSLFIPVTINGWGVREGVWMAVLSPFTDHATAFLASVMLAITTTYFLALIGGLLEIFGIRASFK